jgi:putative ABC transport system permease protein
MNEVIAESVKEPKFTVLLLFTFAITALILTSVGIYGVISYFVNQRTHEIGVRMALGAQSQDIFGLVMSRGVLPALAGIAIGVVAAVSLTHFMRSLLFNVSATDPMIFVALAALLSAVAIIASLVPALRATRVDPMVALRNE